MISPHNIIYVVVEIYDPQLSFLLKTMKAYILGLEAMI